VQENGTTTFLPTVIPHFKKVIVSSFSCGCCGHRNSELQIADYEEKGCRYQLKVEGVESLNRQIVKSDRATIVIPDLDFEIPTSPESKSVITSLEGLLVQHIENLEAGQPVRHIMEPATAAKIDAFLVQLRKCAAGEQTFTLTTLSIRPLVLVLDDFLSADEAEFIKDTSYDRMARSGVVMMDSGSASDGGGDQTRTSTSTYLESRGSV
jgi:ZPR1 zinc finger protein